MLRIAELRSIARVAEVSERWLQNYVNQKYYLTPKEAKISQKKRGKLVLEIDEMWSFIGSKRNKVWIWLAIDSLTKEIVGVHVGARDRAFGSVPEAIESSIRCAFDAIALQQENYGTPCHQFTVKDYAFRLGRRNL